MERKDGRIFVKEGGICFSLKESDFKASSIAIEARPQNSNGAWRVAAEVSTQEACVTRVHSGWENSPELFPIVSTVCSLCVHLAA